MTAYANSEDLRIWFLTIYDKAEAEDLTPDQRRMLKAAIDREKQERAHATRRRRQDDAKSSPRNPSAGTSSVS